MSQARRDSLPRTPFGFVLYVAPAPFRARLLWLVLGEAAHSVCGILLPYLLSRILTGVTRGGSTAVRMLQATDYHRLLETDSNLGHDNKKCSKRE